MAIVYRTGNGQSSGRVPPYRDEWRNARGGNGTPQPVRSVYVRQYHTENEIWNLLSNPKSNLNKQNAHGKLPLGSAARGNMISYAEQLIVNGADVNAQDDEGMTALMHAVEMRNGKMARILAELGASIGIVSNNKGRAIDIARDSGNIMLASKLKEWETNRPVPAPG